MHHHPMIPLLNGLLLVALLTSLISASMAAAQSETAPDTVTIPGTLQSELGCSGDWMPSCAKTDLTYAPDLD